MQYLEIPVTLKDMTVSLSMTGVTILTKTRFKKRHQGLKDLQQVPIKGFEPIPVKRGNPNLTAKKRKSLKETENRGIPKQTSQIRVPKYKVDKREVSHRIRNYLNQMSGEKMLYFWTVTFPIKTPDDTAYILLNKWLTRLRQEKMLREYLWIAERQENGTIHFHMVLNQKMNVQKANKFMRASILHSINKGEIQYSRIDAIRYNGVDICKDRKSRRVTNFAKKKREKSLSNYLTKYVTKNDGRFLHLAWHSSRGYSNLITAVRFTWEEYSKGNTENLLDNSKEIVHEFYTFRRWKTSPPKDLLMYLGLLNASIQKKFSDS
jgi:hypothetical protein